MTFPANKADLPKLRRLLEAAERAAATISRCLEAQQKVADEQAAGREVEASVCIYVKSSIGRVQDCTEIKVHCQEAYNALAREAYAAQTQLASIDFATAMAPAEGGAK